MLRYIQNENCPHFKPSLNGKLAKIFQYSWFKKFNTICHGHDNNHWRQCTLFLSIVMHTQDVVSKKCRYMSHILKSGLKPLQLVGIVVTCSTLKAAMLGRTIILISKIVCELTTVCFKQLPCSINQRTKQWSHFFFLYHCSANEYLPSTSLVECTPLFITLFCCIAVLLCELYYFIKWLTVPHCDIMVSPCHLPKNLLNMRSFGNLWCLVQFFLFSCWNEYTFIYSL